MIQQESDSTLIRRGRNALTFSEMAQFAETLSNRPLTKLLEELPELARLSTAKFNLATITLRRRIRSEAPVDQIQLRAIANEIAATVDEPVAARRIRDLFAQDLA
jgi:hypothetical protein